MVSTIVAAPAVLDGVRAVITVALVTTTLKASAPPTVTVAPFMKPDPLSEIDVFPAAGPLVGDTDESVGGVPR